MKKIKKGEINEDDLPPIKRLIVPVNMVNIKDNIAKISEIFGKTERKDTIIVSLKTVLEYAEENELFFNTEDMDPKKKIPEGIPTKLTKDLKHEFYRKFIKEQDFMGRLYKRECLEAEEKGKAPPNDPRFEESKKKDAKKKKKGKNEPEEEEEKELEDDTKELEGDFDYIYVLTDFGTNQDEIIELFGFDNVFFCSSLVEGVLPPPKETTYEEQLGVLNSQILDPKKFEEDYRRRIDQFINGDFEKSGMSKEERKKYMEVIEQFSLRIENLVRDSGKNTAISSWRVFEAPFNYKEIENLDPEILWPYYFRNTILRSVCDYTNKIQEYRDFVGGLDLLKIVDEDPELVREIRHIKEEKARKEEEERLAREMEERDKLNKKNKKKKPAKKGKKGKKEEEEEEERLRKEMEEERRKKEEEEKKQLEDKDTKQEIIFEPFATFNTQLSTLEHDQLTVGCFLEAFIDELSKRENGFIISQQPKNTPEDKFEASKKMNDYLSDVFSSLTANKMVNHLEVIFNKTDADIDTTNLHSSVFKIFKDMDLLGKNLADSTLHNHDKIFPRVKLILDEIKFGEIERLSKLTKDSTNEIEQKLETTEVYSRVQWQIQEFIRKHYLIEFEKIFSEKEELKKWDFSDRIYTEELDEMTLKQKLIDILKDDPNVITHYEEKLGLLYLGFYFKTPPGRCYYKKWKNRDKLIPGFKNWDMNIRGKTDLPEDSLKFFNISEEDYDQIEEQRSLFFPTDGGIIDVTNYNVKFQNKSRIVVKKGRMIFGIKEAYIYGENETSDPINDNSVISNKQIEKDINNEIKGGEESKEGGLSEVIKQHKFKQSVTILEESFVEDSPSKQGCELWYSYDSGTRMHIELEKIDVDVKTLAFEKKIMNKKHLPLTEMKAQVTFSMVSGIVVKINGNRDALMFSNYQQKVKPNKLLEAIGLTHLASTDTFEFARIVTEEGAVIKKMSDGSTIIMYPDGKMQMARGNSSFKTVDIDGIFSLPEQNEDEISVNSMKNLKSTKKIDPDTEIISIVREDRMVSFIYPDGSKVFNFPDSTKITVNNDASDIKIEHPDYPTFVSKFDKFRARNPPVIGQGSSFASKGRKNVLERSYTGRITTLYLKDGTMVRTYQEMRELPGYNKYKLVNVSLVYGYDSSISKVESTGETVILDALDFTKVDRTEVTKMNMSTMSNGNNGFANKSRLSSAPIKQMDEPIGLKGIKSDYFIQLFLRFQERDEGVYTVDLKNKTLQTMDKQGNIFKVRSDGKVNSKIAISFNLKEKKNKWDKFPKFDSDDFIDPENLDLPIPEKWNQPHLFLISKDKTALSFYTESMLSAYWGQKSLANSRIVTVNDDKTGSTGMLILTESSKTPGEKNQEYSSNLESVEKATPNSFKPLPGTTLGKFEEKVKKYSLRILKKYDELTPEDRNNKQIVTEQVIKYRKEKEDFDKEKVIWDRSKEQQDEEFDIQQKIMCLSGDNILVFNQSNKEEINNTGSVMFLENGERDIFNQNILD